MSSTNPGPQVDPSEDPAGGGGGQTQVDPSEDQGGGEVDPSEGEGGGATA